MVTVALACAAAHSRHNAGACTFGPSLQEHKVDVVTANAGHEHVPHFDSSWSTAWRCRATKEHQGLG